MKPIKFPEEKILEWFESKRENYGKLKQMRENSYKVAGQTRIPFNEAKSLPDHVLFPKP